MSPKKVCLTEVCLTKEGLGRRYVWPKRVMKKVCLTKEGLGRRYVWPKRVMKKVCLTKEGYEEGMSDQRGL